MPNADTLLIQTHSDGPSNFPNNEGWTILFSMIPMERRCFGMLLQLPNTVLNFWWTILSCKVCPKLSANSQPTAEYLIRKKCHNLPPRKYSAFLTRPRFQSLRALTVGTNKCIADYRKHSLLLRPGHLHSALLILTYLSHKKACGALTSGKVFTPFLLMYKGQPSRGLTRPGPLLSQHKKRILSGDHALCRFSRK